MNTQLKQLNFYLVLCKTKKKLDKYIKLNRVRKKYIIDINKMIEEEEYTVEDALNSDLFKILVLKKFNLAKEKKKDIYYIPLIDNKYSNLSKIFNIKDLLSNTHNFNLLYFYDDFDHNQQPDEILNNIADFDLSQILKDY